MYFEQRYHVGPLGIGLALLALGFPKLLAPAVAMLLFLGYDLTQPLFAGIVTSLGGKRPGQAMGLNVFTLFIGFGLGSLVFGELLSYGFAVVLGRSRPSRRRWPCCLFPCFASRFANDGRFDLRVGSKVYAVILHAMPPP